MKEYKEIEPGTYQVVQDGCNRGVVDLNTGIGMIIGEQFKVNVPKTVLNIGLFSHLEGETIVYEHVSGKLFKIVLGDENKNRGGKKHRFRSTMTVPKWLREKFDIEVGDKAIFKIVNGDLAVEFYSKSL